MSVEEIITYHPNKNICKKYKLINGKLHGKLERWYENGQKDFEWNYVDGKRHGVFKCWFQNGQQSVECTYVDGVLHGKYESWYTDGRKYQDLIFENGNQRDKSFVSWYSNLQSWIQTIND